MNTLFSWINENIDSLPDGVYSADSFNSYILKDGELFKVSVKTNNETRMVTIKNGKMVKCEDFS